MSRKSVYLLLSLAGVAVPFREFLPWLADHGLNVALFLEHLFANPISSFFAADVFISAIVVFVFAATERRTLGTFWWTPMLAVLLAGVSLGLPLLLFLREARQQPVSSLHFHS